MLAKKNEQNRALTLMETKEDTDKFNATATMVYGTDDNFITSPDDMNATRFVKLRIVC